MTVKEEIEQLKKERNAVILAHYYTRPEVQEIADYTGDSFYLSKVAVNLKEQVIVFCGVSFMGESAKALNPDKTVLMPDADADCAMAHMADAETIRKMRSEYDDLAVVCYVNSTAQLKQYSDVCVTSANAVQVVKALPNKNIFFIPDRNLAHFIAEQVPEKHFIFNEGYCPVHEKMQVAEIRKAKAEHPAAEVLTHPECPGEVLALSDYVGSTSGIIKYAGESSAKEFIICTETGVSYELEKKYPDKKFYFTETEPVCQDMKIITLEKILHVLKTGENEVRMPEELVHTSKKPLEKMLDLAASKAQETTEIRADVVIVGTGAAGLFAALNLPRDKKVLIITKKDAESSDSFLAQGGICVLRNEDDYDSYFEDTMRAGHYENRKESVDIMIRSSREVISDLIGYGVKFQRRSEGEDNDAEGFLADYAFTREGAHSRPRILFHEDVTGKEITGKLLEQVRSLENVTLREYTTMTDIIVENYADKDGVSDRRCNGIIAEDSKGNRMMIRADDTILASGGIGGLYKHSTNYSHLTGDALEIAKKHGIQLEHLDYVQIHPTTLYSKKPGRRFLISESVRGEGAVLLDKNGERFTDELQPRDVVTAAIRRQMEKDGTDHVWLSMKTIDKDTIMKHFPNIYEHCLEEGYDVTKDWIPVVPAQHYFMGGIWVDSDSRTSMKRLFAAGETSCNGVHGANRLASNSLLESLVFAKRAARKIAEEREEEV